MDDKKIKKKKLTLSGSFKRQVERPNYARGQNKSRVLVETRTHRGKNIQKGTAKREFVNEPSNQKQNIYQNDLSKKKFIFQKNSNIRKLAEQKATKRIKGENVEDFNKGKNQDKTKSFNEKRAYKLTISRALNQEESFKERSLASVRRARIKSKKTSQNNDTNSLSQKVIREVNIPDAITIRELSNRMAEQTGNLIKFLLGMGVKATINHTIDADTAEYLVKELGHKAIREKSPDLKFKKLNTADQKLLKSRPPVVTVMGHVDHGKTSLLDALRQANVVSGEHGGITQHIGAYQVEMDNGKNITFIDTPGHAAFTEMRARGSKVTDIVVLVVAADEGVKPQTIEAINHAKDASVPIIVAINKCDLPGADPQKIKNELLQYELVAEELSGDTLFSEVSSVTKKNLDKLKSNINIQAEMLDLKANPDDKASGVILESRIDKGRGPVSTVLITNGSLSKGNFFVSGTTWGKVRAMIDYKGNQTEIAGPSTPVEILGMNSSSISGDDFIVVESEAKAKEINNYRLGENESTTKTKSLIGSTQESLFETSQKAKILPIIIKSDVQGSSEALKNSINKIKHEEVSPKIVLADIGLISETDVSLAKASGAILLGFNVKASKEAKKLAENFKIDIKFFSIIYEVLDHVTSALSGLLKPHVEEKIIGSAEIQEIFKVSKIGKVAGSKVIEGEIISNSNARLIRDGSVLYTGKISSIFREKNAAKQVSAGLECGITLKDFADFKEKDVIESYKVTETERRI